MQNNDNRKSEDSQSPLDIEFDEDIPDFASDELPPHSNRTVSATLQAGVATQQIIQKVGGPFIENNRGGYSINQSFFAENFGRIRPVIHDRASGRYYQYLPKNGLYQELRADTVRAAISDDIFAEARNCQIKGVGAKITRHLQMSIEAMAKELISHDDFFAPGWSRNCKSSGWTRRNERRKEKRERKPQGSGPLSDCRYFQRRAARSSSRRRVGLGPTTLKC